MSVNCALIEAASLVPSFIFIYNDNTFAQLLFLISDIYHQLQSY